MGLPMWRLKVSQHRTAAAMRASDLGRRWRLAVRLRSSLRWTADPRRLACLPDRPAISGGLPEWEISCHRAGVSDASRGTRLPQWDRAAG